MSNKNNQQNHKTTHQQHHQDNSAISNPPTQRGQEKGSSYKMLAFTIQFPNNNPTPTDHTPTKGYASNRHRKHRNTKPKGLLLQNPTACQTTPAPPANTTIPTTPTPHPTTVERSNGTAYYARINQQHQAQPTPHTTPPTGRHRMPRFIDIPPMSNPPANTRDRNRQP